MKKVLRVLIGIIVFGAILAASVIFAGRKLLSPNNISSLIQVIVKSEGEKSLKEVVFEDIENDEISKYIKDKDLEKAMGEYLGSAIKVASGAADKIESDKIEKLLKDAAKKYSEETGKKYDEKEIDKALKEMNSKFTDEIKQEDRATFKPLNYVFDSKPLIICLVIIAVGLGLIYLLSQSIETLLFHAGLTTFISSLLIKLGVGAISKLLAGELDDKVANDLLNNVVNSINHIAIIGLIIGVVLLAVAVFLKLRAKQDKPAPSSSSPVPESTTTYDYDNLPENPETSYDEETSSLSEETEEEKNNNL